MFIYFITSPCEKRSNNMKSQKSRSNNIKKTITTHKNITVHQLAHGFWELDVSSMKEHVQFSIYIYIYITILMTSSHSYENLGLVLILILACQSANWFSLWKLSWEPSGHLRTALHWFIFADHYDLKNELNKQGWGLVYLHVVIFMCYITLFYIVLIFSQIFHAIIVLTPFFLFNLLLVPNQWMGICLQFIVYIDYFFLYIVFEWECQH